MIDDMMTREDGAGQRFPHGSQLPEEELRVFCDLCEITSASPTDIQRISAQTLPAAIPRCCSRLGKHCYAQPTANHDWDRPSPPSPCPSLQDHTTWARSGSPGAPPSLLLPLYDSMGATGPEFGLSRMSFELFEDA